MGRLFLLSQKVAIFDPGIAGIFGRFVFRHGELGWVT
ncbi:hypothetical protein ABIB95_009269, partial [Bradyrhizobium sp. LA2.1]